MPDDKVKIGFVGVGSMGQCAHLKNYVIIPECTVVAIAEIREKMAKRVAEKYGIPHVYSSYEKMLKEQKIDGLVVSQPFTRHGVLIPELLKYGIPIFTEKPLAGTIEMGKKIIAVLKKSGTWHMVGYHKRSDPASMYVKKEVDRLKETGELGNLRYIRILMPAGDWIAGGFNDLIKGEELPANLEFDPPDKEMDKDTYNVYLSFVNYYIHQVNLLRYFLGESYDVTYADPSGILLVGKSRSGVTCVIEMTPYRTTIDWQESVLIAFERGYIRLELPAPLASCRAGRVVLFRDRGNGETPETIIPQFPWIHAMMQQAINFVQAIKGKVKPMCEAAEALEDLEVARQYIRLLKGK